MITELEQQNLDIDWFFLNKDNICFVASGGGKLPVSVAKSFEMNNALSTFFKSLPIISEVIVNPNLNNIIATNVNEKYLSDFIQMSQRGLFSFDKTVLNNFAESHYHLVAKPVTPFKRNDLPAEILKIISKSIYQGDISTAIDIKLVT